MTTQTEALKMALDFIIATNKSSQFWLVPESNLNKTVTAIKEALAQPEEQHSCDKQEPVAKNELGRIKWLVDDWPANCFLYAEPPKWTSVEIGVDVTLEGTHVVAMYVLPDAVRHVFYSQFHPLAKPEPEPACWNGNCPNTKDCEQAMQCLYTTPPQPKEPEQEPVAWKNAAIRLGEELSSVGPDGYYDMTAKQWLDWAIEQRPQGKNSLPPQRTWVGLTDDDKVLIKHDANFNQFMTAGEYADRVQQLTEARLKDKNI